MKGVIFSGPSLPRDLVKEVPGVEWRPPVRQGDVHNVALSRPAVIGIVDGFFETTPTVWHKEILWAMSQGIHVYGASSIGALRAVELETFGMKGLGRVFEMFRSGELADDDEVAILHGPAELDYLPLTEAMVNIRVTIDCAVDTGMLSAQQAEALRRAAKNLFFKERTFSRLIDAAKGLELPQSTLDDLSRWWPNHKIDQKRTDAILMLQRIAHDLSSDIRPFQAGYTVACTPMLFTLASKIL